MWPPKRQQYDQLDRNNMLYLHPSSLKKSVVVDLQQKKGQDKMCKRRGTQEKAIKSTESEQNDLLTFFKVTEISGC